MSDLCANLPSSLFEDRLFFQIAAALIPTLLLGSHLSGVVSPSVLPPIRSPRAFLLIVIPVGVALMAEIFAIDLATAPSDLRFGLFEAVEVATVVTVVTGLTALAGVALLRPWLTDLTTPHKRLVRSAVYIGAPTLSLLAGLLLTTSIADARGRLVDQRAACIQAASASLIRETRADRFAAQDAVNSAQADILRLVEQSVLLRHERNLTRAERRVRQKVLQAQISHASVRAKEAGEQYRLAILENPLDETLYSAAREARSKDQDKFIERFTRAFGC